jgi:hypothetical protein
LPFVFAIGFLLIEARRQAALARAQAPESVNASYDWITLLWSIGCALAGAAAFVVAWTAQPAPAQEEEIWTPPESSVSVDISP